MEEPKIIPTRTGKEAFLHSLTQAGLIVTPSSGDIQYLYQREGDKFLCLIHKSGTRLNSKEAVELTYDEYKAHFLKHLKAHSLFHHFQNRKVITCK